jgi:hypothetical protein
MVYLSIGSEEGRLSEQPRQRLNLFSRSLRRDALRLRRDSESYFPANANSLMFGWSCNMLESAFWEKVSEYEISYYLGIINWIVEVRPCLWSLPPSRPAFSLS